MPTRYIVIDDDEINNFLCLKSITIALGDVDSLSFTQPEDALEYLTKHYTGAETDVATVIFLDINMPTMTGWEFIDEFAKLPEKIISLFTIFILSSSVNYQDKKTAKENRYITDFLEKPLTADKILHSLAKITG